MFTDIFDEFLNFLRGSVGNGLANEPDDVRTTKRNLGRLGFFDDDTENGFVTRELDSGIKAFQRANDLHVDGSLLPRGETEQAIFQTMERRAEDGPATLQTLEKRAEDGPAIIQTMEQRNSLGPFGSTIKLLSLDSKGDQQGQSSESTGGNARENSPGRTAPQSDDPTAQLDATGRMIRPENTLPAPGPTPEPVPVPEIRPIDASSRPPILKGADSKSVRDAIEVEEGNTTYLYKDTAKGGGEVTVGIGIMLPDAEAAKKLPFTAPDGKGGRRPATDAEIEQAFEKVDAIDNDNSVEESFKPGEGRKAKGHNLDDLQLPKDVADRILDKRLRADANRLRDIFPEFDDYPVSAQQALLDMQYNLGSTNFRASRIVNGQQKGWPKLFKAVEKQNWAQAAMESHRIGVGEKRNDRTGSWFNDAHEAQR